MCAIDNVAICMQGNTTQLNGSQMVHIKHSLNKAGARVRAESKYTVGQNNPMLIWNSLFTSFPDDVAQSNKMPDLTNYFIMPVFGWALLLVLSLKFLPGTCSSVVYAPLFHS